MIKSSGFSLIELVIVITLIAILAATVMTKSVGRENFDLSALAQTMSQDIQLTQILAMSYNEPHQILLKAQSYEVNGQFIDVPKGVSLSSSHNPLRFNPMGQPIDIKGRALNKDIILTFSTTGESKKITIMNVTGFVSP